MLEDLIDRKIFLEPPSPASAEQLKKLFLQTLNVATYKSDLVGFFQGTVESEIENLQGTSKGEVLFRRLFPIQRKVGQLRRIPADVIGRRDKKPKLTIELSPSLYNVDQLIVNMRDLTAYHHAANPLGADHPLTQVAEIKLSWPYQTRTVATVGYETDHKGQVMQPHWDRQPLKLWKPMTSPQAKMLARMLPGS